MSHSLKNNLRSVYRTVYTIFDSAESGVAILGLVALSLIMILTTGNAVARYLINDPINGTYEIIELYLMPIVIFLYAARLQKNDGNINVDILYTRLPEKVQMLIDLIGRASALVIFAAISYISGVKFWNGFIEGRTSVGVIEFPIYISWLIMSVGLLILAVRLLYQIKTNLFKLYELISGDAHSEVTE